jgi:outer membrane immunogenic protein
MKYRIIRALVATALFIATPLSVASAADMPLKAPPPPPPPVYSWTGFYLGGNVGGAWTSEQFSTADPFNSFGLAGSAFTPVNLSSQGSGAIGGVHGGYNWQFATSGLIGVEGDFDWTSLKLGIRSAPLNSPFIAANSFTDSNLNVRDLSSIRGRAGFIVSDFLVYATGGVAFEDRHFFGEVSCPSTGAGACIRLPEYASATLNKVQTGSVFGAGVEYKPPTTNWIFGVEYLNYHFGGFTALSPTINAATGALSPFNASCPGNGSCVSFAQGSVDISAVRARLSYKF